MQEDKNFAALLILFNRPQYIDKSIEIINNSPIKNLYVHIDGPRNKADSEKIELIENAFKNLNKDIYTKIMKQSKNLGCGLGPYTAINWFFKYEDAGMIIEDDVMPNNSFFNYCNLLLKKFEKDKNIFLISGDNGGNIIPEKYFKDSQIILAPTPLIWGWATWKSRWISYKYNDINVSFHKLLKQLKSFKPFERIILYFYFLKIKKNEKPDFWDIQLFHLVATNNYHGVIPRTNLIKNIGFDENATHTKNINSRSHSETNEIELTNIFPQYTSKLLNSKIIYLLKTDIDSEIIHLKSLAYIRFIYLKGRFFYLLKVISAKLNKHLKIINLKKQ